VNTDPSHLTRLFKKATGLTPHRYLIMIRVDRARRLLLSTDESIAEVAAHVGFADQSHLNRHFKRIVGITPGAFVLAR
jgi:AraC family transcriptional regulator